MPSLAIEYFRPEYAPNLVLFHCAQQRMDVSRDACAGFHTRQHTVACGRCEIGAHHAGRSSPPEQTTQGKICDRCERHATRMIRGRLCVSCYNREREVAAGRNGKGSTPLLVLYTADLLLFGPPPETGFAREVIDADHMLLSFLARDRAEVDRTIRRIQAGGAKILDYSLSARRPLKIFTPPQSRHGRAAWSILHGQHPQPRHHHELHCNP